MGTMAHQSNSKGVGKKPDERTLEFPREYPILAPTPGFRELCEGYGIELETGELERLARFLSLMLASNEVVNLTAMTEPAEAWQHHIFDSLSLLPFFQELSEGMAEVGQRLAVADVGSGGGMPAIPLAIVLPDVDFTLIESTGKKTAFLSHAIAELELPNVRVLKARAEDVGQDFRTHREAYDLVTARAVGRIIVLSELTSALAKVGGMVLMTKGKKAEEELDEATLALKKLGLSHAGTHETPTGRLVALEKLEQTPRPYPRRPGEPKRAPIGSSGVSTK
jgi:16S rRNA (guanine527-N7)-methyltransferase